MKIDDKVLLASYIIRPAVQDKNPILAYGLPIYNNTISLVSVTGKEIRVLELQELYEWALACGVIVERPITSKQLPFTEQDGKAYERLEDIQEKERRTEIDIYLSRIKRMLGKA